MTSRMRQGSVELLVLVELMVLVELLDPAERPAAWRAEPEP